MVFSFFPSHILNFIEQVLTNCLEGNGFIFRSFPSEDRDIMSVSGVFWFVIEFLQWDSASNLEASPNKYIYQVSPRRFLTNMEQTD